MLEACLCLENQSGRGIRNIRDVMWYAQDPNGRGASDLTAGLLNRTVVQARISSATDIPIQVEAPAVLWNAGSER